jgi:hypothetical protein
MSGGSSPKKNSITSLAEYHQTVWKERFPTGERKPMEHTDHSQQE